MQFTVAANTKVLTAAFLPPATVISTVVVVYVYFNSSPAALTPQIIYLEIQRRGGGSNSILFQGKYGVGLKHQPTTQGALQENVLQSEGIFGNIVAANANLKLGL